MKIAVKSKKISSTLLISMTDVIFLLIIFLLIASNFASQTGLPIKLPGSNSSVRQTHQVVHVIYMDNTQIEFMGKVIPMEALHSELLKAYQSKEQVVRLSADKSTPLQTVITLMDTIRGAGFEKIFVATEGLSNAQ